MTSSPRGLPQQDQACDHELTLRGGGLEVSLDPCVGGAVTRLARPGSPGLLAPRGRVAMHQEFPQGMGIRGGVHWHGGIANRSSRWADPMACESLPDLDGGARLRMQEFDRDTASRCEVILHVHPTEPWLLVVVRQEATTGERAARLCTTVDDVRAQPGSSGFETTLASDRGVAHIATSHARERRQDPFGVTLVADHQDDLPAWELWSLGGQVPVDKRRPWVEAAIRGADDAALARDHDGTGWLALEAERAAGGTGPGLCPGRGADGRWWHLLRGDGLGVADRVNPADPGVPAGLHWEAEIRRAIRRQALGDWRLHLRAGEVHFLRRELVPARERWEYANALRPTCWSERNLGLVAAATGDRRAAAVHYLRAHRMDPTDMELGVEAVGCLLRAERVGDVPTILDRMVDAGLDGSAQWWLLEAERAMAAGEGRQMASALARSALCPDAPVGHEWAERLANGTPA